MLAAVNLEKTFPNGRKAYRNLSFAAEKGEIIGFLGTSGCGKSTLLRNISGLDPQYDGSLKIDGKTVKGISEKIGFIFQEPRLMPWLTVQENIAFGLKKSTADRRKAAETFIRLVGLDGFEHHYPRELSGGMAQRVAIARALVTRPEILLLDEPFSALDAFTKMQLQDLLLDVWQTSGATIMIVTHDIDEALYLCDRLFILKGQPGQLEREVAIDRPRPRSRTDENLAKEKEQILNMLHIAHGAS